MVNTAMPKSVLLIFIPILIIAGFGIDHFIRQPEARYKITLQTCKNDSQKRYATCVATQILILTDEHPEQTGRFLDYIYGNARTIQTIDLRIFSDYSHHAGMQLATKPVNLIQAAKFCGSAFKSGCLHGFVMARIDSTMPKSNPKDLIKYCDPLWATNSAEEYANCLHGIGHVLWAQATDPLQRVLEHCDQYVTGVNAVACKSGVLMEYSKGSQHTGFHSDASVGSAELPCSSIAQRDKALCYASAASYRYYYPGQENPSVGMGYCNSVPVPYQPSCLSAVKERLALATGKL